MAIKLLQKYGHGNLTVFLEKIEEEFISKVMETEKEALHLLNEGGKEEAVYLLTLVDLEIQMKAISIEEMLLNTTLYDLQFLINKLLLYSNIPRLAISMLSNTFYKLCFYGG